MRFYHLLALLGMWLSYLAGQIPAVSTPEVQTALQKFSSTDWIVRSAGFYELVKLGTVNDKQSEFPISDGVLAFAHLSKGSRAMLANHLNRLLAVENDYIQSDSAPLSDDYSTYHGDVIEAVTTMREQSSLSVLLGSINTGGMAVRAVARLGDDALDGALSKLPFSDEETRHSIFRMLTEMSEARNLANLKKKESVSLLRSAPISGATETNPRTREIVMDGLARIGTLDEVTLLKQLANSDPFVSSGLGPAHYPVRDAAAKAMTAIVGH